MSESRMAGVAQWIDDFATVLAGNLDELGERVGQQLGHPSPRTTDIDIEDRCRAMLADADTPVIGAGVVLLPHVLVDRDYWMDWWAYARPGASSTITQRTYIREPPLGQPDFTQSSWFRIPRESGTMHVTGPMVDYEQTFAYVLTATQAFHVGSRFAGVVGADVHVSWLENVLQPMLAAVPDPCLVVAANGRVIASADPALMPGDVLRDPSLLLTGARQPAGSRWLSRSCENVPFTVVAHRG